MNRFCKDYAIKKRRSRACGLKPAMGVENILHARSALYHFGCPFPLYGGFPFVQPEEMSDTERKLLRVVTDIDERGIE